MCGSKRLLAVCGFLLLAISADAQQLPPPQKTDGVPPKVPEHLRPTLPMPWPVADPGLICPLIPTKNLLESGPFSSLPRVEPIKEMAEGNPTDESKKLQSSILEERDSVEILKIWYVTDGKLFIRTPYGITEVDWCARSGGEKVLGWFRFSWHAIVGVVEALQKAAEHRSSKVVYFFDQAATFPQQRFRPNGGDICTDGVVIYEGMKIVCSPDGTYLIDFVATIPERPVTMYWQFTFHNSSGPAFNITVPPIHLQPPLRFNEDGKSHLTYRIQHKGYSPRLENICSTAFAVSRNGSARFGSVIPSSLEFGLGSSAPGYGGR